MFGCVSIFTIVRGLIFIPHTNTILADYKKAQFYLKKPTLINKNTTFHTETVSHQNLPINAETPDRYHTVTDPLPPCTITVFNLAFFPFFILLTRAKKKTVSTAPSKQRVRKREEETNSNVSRKLSKWPREPSHGRARDINRPPLKI